MTAAAKRQPPAAAKASAAAPDREDKPTLKRKVAEAEARYDRAQCNLRRAEEQLDFAKTRLDEASVDGPAPTAKKQAVTDAQIDLESCQRIERKAFAALEAAKAALSRLEAIEDVEQLDRLIATLRTYSESISRRAEEAIAHDRTVADWASTVVAEHVRFADVYAEAEAIASRRRLTPRLDQAVRQPSLADARLTIARRVTEARLTEGREPVTPWLLAHVDGDVTWARRGFTATELAQADAHRSAWQARMDAEANGRALMHAVAAGMNTAAGVPAPEAKQPMPTLEEIEANAKGHVWREEPRPHATEDEPNAE